MGLNDIPSSERLHIGFFGRRNAGKSSIVNAVTNQGLSLVSDVAGTTTDPVYKAMELLPLGPVVIIDTAGFDDEGELGQMRVQSTRKALNRTDIAVLVTDAQVGIGQWERELVELFEKKQIPFLIAVNKTDIVSGKVQGENCAYVSAKTGDGIEELKEKLGALADKPGRAARIIGDKLERNDLVVLVVPIDESAPKGRLILIDGELQTRGYSDNNGNIQSWTEVVANRVSFTGERSDDTRRDDEEIPPPLMPPGDGERYIFDDDYLEY